MIYIAPISLKKSGALVGGLLAGGKG